MCRIPLEYHVLAYFVVYSLVISFTIAMCCFFKSKSTDWTWICSYTVYIHFTILLPLLVILLSFRRGLSEGRFVLLLSVGGWPAQRQVGVWVFIIFSPLSSSFLLQSICIDICLSAFSRFLYAHFSLSCFQTVWQRWQWSPWQLCKSICNIFCELQRITTPP